VRKEEDERGEEKGSFSWCFAVFAAPGLGEKTGRERGLTLGLTTWSVV
jgi:hypothetical protein